MKRAQGARITRTVDAEKAAGTDKAPVTDPASDGGADATGTPEDRFTEMTSKELKAEAKDRNIDLTGLKTVGELRTLLRSLEK